MRKRERQTNVYVWFLNGKVSLIIRNVWWVINMHPLIIEVNEKVDGRNMKMFDGKMFAIFFCINENKCAWINYLTLFIFTQWNEYWNAKQRAQHMYMVCRFYYQFTQRISTRNVSKKKIKRSLMVIIFIISSCSNDGFSQQSAAMHNMLFNFIARCVYNIIRFGTGFEKATISRIMVTY